MIERLLPARVACAETRRALLDTELFPEEERALGDAVQKRRREFLTGRACARRALRELGAPAAPILSGPRGEPLWPAGVVGSLTHCRGYTACAVARAHDLLALGIDAEPNTELPAGVLARVAFGTEREQSVGGGTVHPGKLLFSAKEAVYKAWFPLTREELSFEQVRVSFDPVRARFRAALLVDPPLIGVSRLAALCGRWSLCDGVIVTAVAVAHGSTP